MPSATQLSQLPTKYEGLRYIAFKSQVLASTGVVSLDSILGGGVPLGTLLLIEEDEFGALSEILMRYYYAEGLASKNSLFIASSDVNKRKLIYRLPDIAQSEEVVSEGDNTGDFKMKIAWRYQSNSEASSTPSSTNLFPNFGHHFDLTSNVPREAVDSADIVLCPQDIEDSCSYEKVLRELKEVLECKDGIVRIGVHSLGSFAWTSDHSTLPAFLYTLRCLLHNNHCSMAIATISPHLIKNDKILKQCEDICDTVLSLESLVNNSNPIYSEYKALVDILKYPSINSLSAYRPEANDWALKLHRRKCVIEKLHIPAEVENKDKRESTSDPLCHRPSGNLDF